MSYAPKALRTVSHMQLALNKCQGFSIIFAFSFRETMYEKPISIFGEDTYTVACVNQQLVPAYNRGPYEKSEFTY